MNQRIYLDHAATRFPKPAVVLDTMHAFATSDEAAVGRGAYRASQHAAEIVTRLRREIARWIGAATDQEISLHAGGTEALNAALLGMLQPGDHVVTTAAEHNSVLRPLMHLVAQKTITLSVVQVDEGGQVCVKHIMDAINPQTRMVAVVHAANVNGAVQPINAIAGRLNREFDAKAKPLFFCDAAQSFGHLPLAVVENHIDVLAAPGHKGGCGPLGTGFLYVRQDLHSEIRPTLFGGTGTQSESFEMPTDYPSSFEAGNMNVPAIAGWLAGLQARSQASSAQTALLESSHTLQALAAELYQRLHLIDGVQIIGQPSAMELPVASIALRDLPASDAAMILDSEFGIEVRSGLHCAALIHHFIGSPPDGTLRISCGPTTTLQDLNTLADALAEICE